MGTIVQEYGPFIGEVVNGTVSGRPNGSVYVPPNNSIEFVGDLPERLYYDSGRKQLRLYVAAPNNDSYAYSVAQMQDLSMNYGITIYSDAELTTAIGSRKPASQAATFGWRVVASSIESNPLTEGETYYAVLTIYSGTTPVVSSTVYEVEAVGSLT